MVVHPLQIEVLISNREMKEFMTFNGLVPITLKVEKEALNTPSTISTIKTLACCLLTP